MSGYEELIASKGTETPAAEAPPPVVDVAPEPAPVVSEPAPSEVQAPPVVETQPAAAAPAAPAEPQEHTVPLPVLLRTRDELGGKLTAAEQRALAAERRLAEIDRQRREAAAQAPDILADPDAYIAWSERRTQDMVRQAVASVETKQAQYVETLSRSMMQRHLGPEKFGELDKFIQAAPDQAHAIALKQPDPYGWFYSKFEEAMKHRKAQQALEQIDKFGGKSIEEIVAERVAAELAKQAQPAAPVETAPATDTRPRNPDGTFATSTNQTQRHQPPSLSVVAGAPAPRGGEALSGYDMLTKKRG